MYITLTRRHGIMGRVERMLQPIFTFQHQEDKRPRVSVIQPKTKKDITHKYKIEFHEE